MKRISDPQTIKVLTLHEPWGSMAAWREKEFETRSWGIRPPLPMKLAIHAGKNKEALASIKAELEIERRRGVIIDNLEPFHRHLVRAMMMHGMTDEDGDLVFNRFPFGCILAVCDLIEIVRMTPAFIAQRPEKERAFGDWRPGRFAWRLANVQALPEPVPVRGAQGLWDWHWNGMVA